MPSWKSPLAIALALSGCLGDHPMPTPSSGDLPTDDAGAADPTVRAIVVRDAAGRVHSPSASPRRPVLVVETSVPLIGEPEPAMVLRGVADDALVDDLERPPLRAAHAARVMDAHVERRGTALVVAPTDPLSPGEPYVVALGGWAATADGRPLGAPFLVSLRVAEAGTAGAVATGAWPADGTSGVPTGIPMLAVRFDEDVEGIEGVRLTTAGGRDVPVRRQLVSCELVGWRDGACVVLRPGTRLEASTEHRIVVGEHVTDRTGAAVGPWEARFVTGSAATAREVAWLPPACALDEVATSSTCVLADDRSLTLRVRADAPVRLWAITDHAADSAVAPRGEATLRLDGLSAGTPYAVTLRAVDLTGREQTIPLALATVADLALLSITEVRADARGPEPQQEYVEVANVGLVPVDLEGLSLTDDAGREGDVVTHPFLLAPGARVLFVADGFDPTHPDDDAAPPGVGLIRVGTSLGSGGLKNAGEPLFLRDALGRRLSAAPALPSPGPGACIVRVTGDPRVGDARGFAPDAAGGCTPGRPDRTP